MLDYRPDAPAVEPSPPPSISFCVHWLDIDYPRFGRWIEHILDEWEIPDENLLVETIEVLTWAETPAAARGLRK